MALAYADVAMSLATVCRRDGNQNVSFLLGTQRNDGVHSTRELAREPDRDERDRG